MSSVVNKSGTRFVPKVRQRRSQAPARPVIPKPTPVVVRDPALDLNKDNDTANNNNNNDLLDGATQIPINDKHKDNLNDIKISTDTANNANRNANNTNNNDSDTQLSQVSTQVERNDDHDDVLSAGRPVVPI